MEKIPTPIIAWCTLHNLCLLEEDEVEDFMDMSDNVEADAVEAILPPQPGGAQLQQHVMGLVAALPQ